MVKGEMKMAEKTLKLKEASRRDELLALLDRVMERAYTTYSNKFTKNSERIQWGRLIAQCAAVSGGLLKDKDIEDLEDEMEELKKLVDEGN
jgi:hypothetical protein